MNILQGYRTFIAAALTIFFGFLAQVDWISFLNNPKAGAVAICSGLLMLIMRTITNTPPGESVHPLETENASLIELNRKLKDKLVSTTIGTTANTVVLQDYEHISNNTPEKNEKIYENNIDKVV